VELKADNQPEARPALVVDRLRSARARQVVLSRGGRWALVLSKDNVVQVFDAARGRLVLEKSLRPYTVCRTNAFTPNGRRILVRGDRKVRLLNLWTGQVVREIDGLKKGTLRCSLSGNGTRIVIAQKGQIQVYALEQVQPIVTRASPVTHSVKAVLSDDGAGTLVVAGKDKDGPVIAVWGGEGGRRWRRLSDVGSRRSYVMSGNGRWLAGHGKSGGRIWQLWTGRRQRDFKGKKVMSFSGDQSQAVVADPGGKIQIIDIEKGEVGAEFQTFAGLKGAVVSKDGQRLIAAGGDAKQHRIGRWNVGDAQARFERSDRRRPVRDMRWLDGGKKLRVQLKGMEAFVLIRASSKREPAPPPSPGMRVVLPDGPFRTGRRWRGRWLPKFHARDVALLDDGAGRLKWSKRLDKAALAFDVSANAETAVALDRGGRLYLFEVSDGRLRRSWVDREEEIFTAVATHPIANQVLLVSSSGELCARELADGARRWCRRFSRRAKRALIDVSPSGHYVAVVIKHRLFIFSGAGVVEQRAKIEIPFARPKLLALSPDGGRIALSDGLDITFWDSSTNKRSTTAIFPSDTAVVVMGDGEAVITDALPYLRWRQQFELIPRNDDAVPVLKQLWLKAERPL
jgi:WD40 repeat protein